MLIMSWSSIDNHYSFKLSTLDFHALLSAKKKTKSRKREHNGKGQNLKDGNK